VGVAKRVMVRDVGVSRSLVSLLLFYERPRRRSALILRVMCCAMSSIYECHVHTQLLTRASG
jgi:hypothetical protein